MSVRASVILERKGAQVFTIPPEATLGAAADEMSAHDVGALVVSRGGETVEGVVSERDIVRCITALGLGCMERPVSEMASGDVVTCEPATTADELMALMTERRIRHVPVLDEGRLAGIVSIGDVVKTRLHELEVEKQSLEQYVTGSQA